jgi:hypothetical protein
VLTQDVAFQTDDLATASRLPPTPLRAGRDNALGCGLLESAQRAETV